MTDQEKIAAIKTYLEQNTDLAQLDAASVAVILNQKDPTLTTQIRCDVESSAVRAVFLGSLAPNTQSSSWARIKRCSEGRLSGLPDNVRETLEDLCTTVYDACSLQQTLEPARFDAIDHALTVMQQTGFISADTKNTLEQISWKSVERSWADINIEGRFVSESDIEEARA